VPSSLFQTFNERKEEAYSFSASSLFQTFNERKEARSLLFFIIIPIEMEDLTENWKSSI
jgi:hypothetical protein